MQSLIECPCRRKVAAKRFFDDYSRPPSAARLGQALGYSLKQVWRNSQVVKRAGRAAQRFAQIAECLRRVVIPIDIVKFCRKHRECIGIDTTMLLKAFACAGAKPIKTLSRPRHSDDRHIEVTVPDHSLKCREDLLERQITGGAEEDKCIRTNARHFQPVTRLFPRAR